MSQFVCPECRVPAYAATTYCGGYLIACPDCVSTVDEYGKGAGPFADISAPTRAAAEAKWAERVDEWIADRSPVDIDEAARAMATEVLRARGREAERFAMVTSRLERDFRATLTAIKVRASELVDQDLTRQGRQGYVEKFTHEVLTTTVGG